MEFSKFLLISCFLSALQLRSTLQADIDIGDQDVDETEQYLVSQYNTPGSKPKISQSLHEVVNWPSNSVKLGQVSGVSLDTAGNVYVFHRGDRIWDALSFFVNNTFNEMNQKVIKVPTLAIINPDTGSYISQWGENLFFLPHGITVDEQNNVWFTDVALHQVFKYSPMLSTNVKPTLLMTLGIRFEPGNDADHFCKPTSVAVLSNGDFFVADGYCNARILKFSADGTLISRWGRSTIPDSSSVPTAYHFNIPHGLALAKDKNLLYVADRENGRIQVFHASNGTFAFQFSSAITGTRIFSVAYTPAYGGLIYIVNGQEIEYDIPLRGYSEIYSIPVLVRGYVATAINCQIIADFHPHQSENFHSPHDVAVTPDGSKVYVAELDPHRVWQFAATTNGTLEVLKATVSSPPTSSTIKSSFVSDMLKQDLSLLNKPSDGTLMAVLVVSAALLFGATLLAAMLIYTRSRNRVCGEHCSHRWRPRGRGRDGFSLGILGQRSHSQHGFEKLKTAEESEEEDEEESQTQELQPIV